MNAEKLSLIDQKFQSQFKQSVVKFDTIKELVGSYPDHKNADLP